MYSKPFGAVIGKTKMFIKEKPMYQLGLVAVSFRPESPETVIKAAKAAGLSCIEWGSDVHAPCEDEKRLEEIAALQKEYGISCCSYGTYFRLGVTDVAELPAYIRAAKLLGTKILRLWAGRQHPWDFSAEEKEKLFADSKAAASLAEQAGVKLCLECHKKTYTETAEAALELLTAVNSPAFEMYWQPNQSRSQEENVKNARALKNYVNHIHVFQWKEKERFSLEEGLEEWKAYLEEIPGDRCLLLEFMPNDTLEELPTQTAALRKLTVI